MPIQLHKEVAVHEKQPNMPMQQELMVDVLLPAG
jgi:hypothetical protein